MLRVRRGDKVRVTTGKYRGQTGEVKELLVSRGRVRVEGIATVRRHLKPNVDPRHPEGGIIEKLGSIHISNVQPICPKTDRPTRVGVRLRADGTKVRVARRSGEDLP